MVTLLIIYYAIVCCLIKIWELWVIVIKILYKILSKLMGKELTIFSLIVGVIYILNLIFQSDILRIITYVIVAIFAIVIMVYLIRIILKMYIKF